MKILKQTQEQKKSGPLFKVLKDNPELITPIKAGDVTKGKLLYKDSQHAFFDINNKNIGVIYGLELLNSADILRDLKIGDFATVTVLEEENEDGYAELSLVQAIRQESWQKLREVKSTDDVIKVKIKNANSGGLLTNINGISAFIPVSQLAVDKYPHVEDGDKSKILDELKKLIGQEIEVKVMDIDSRNDKLILSEREVKNSVVKDALEKYKEGDVVKVIVSGIADFGIFVKLKDDPEVEGLVHISEMDHKLIESPKDIVDVDDELEAKIIEIKNGKISLSLKALKDNPWEKASEIFSVGQEIEGTVTKINSFGALVAIGNELQGLIHVSEFESPEKMSEKLKEGDKHTFVVSQLAPEEKRIILKLKE